MLENVNSRLIVIVLYLCLEVVASCQLEDLLKYSAICLWLCTLIRVLRKASVLSVASCYLVVANLVSDLGVRMRKFSSLFLHLPIVFGE